MSDLQQLDEALNFLNEGIIAKFMAYREKKKKEKLLKEKDKKDITERGYTDSDYAKAKKDLQEYIEWSKSKQLNIMDLNNFDIPIACYYCGITESQFITSFNKFAKDDSNLVDPDDYPFEEDDTLYIFLQKNSCYEIGDTIGTPYLWYFPKLKKFMEFYNSEWDDGNTMSYSELINLGKEYFTIKSGNYESHNRYAKACIAADKELGYNKLQ